MHLLLEGHDLAIDYVCHLAHGKIAMQLTPVSYSRAVQTGKSQASHGVKLLGCLVNFEQSFLSIASCFILKINTFLRELCGSEFPLRLALIGIRGKSWKLRHSNWNIQAERRLEC